MNILDSRLSEIIGMTILHSLWQITLLWIALVAVLKLWPKASSTARYNVATGTLIAAVLTTVATAVYQWQSYSQVIVLGPLSNEEAQTTIQVFSQEVDQRFFAKAANAIEAYVPILAWLWCIGLVVMGVRFGGSFYYLKPLRAKQNLSEVPHEWTHELRRLSKALELKREVIIATSTRVSSPLTLGTLSPIILLPAGLLSGLSTKQIETILVHELYHVKRRDYVVNILQAFIEVLLFYHPAIWHINKLIRDERENCCDDKTVAFCGDAIGYARALTQIQEINTLTKPSLAMSATGPNAGNFSNRIKRLFHIYPNPAQARSKGILAVASLVAYLCLILASANVSTAQPAEKQVPLKLTAETKKTYNDGVSQDSIPPRSTTYILDDKEITPLKLRDLDGRNIKSIDVQKVEIIDSMRTGTLDNCVKQVRLLLTTKSFNRPGQKLTKYDFSVNDSLRIVRSIDGLSKREIRFQPTRFDSTRVRRKATRVALVDSMHTSNRQRVVINRLEDTKPLFIIDGVRISKSESNFALKQLDPNTIASITILKNQSATDLYGEDGKDGVVIIELKSATTIDEREKRPALEVFPNSTSDDLNIIFTPSRDNAHVKIVLVDPDGKVVKEITNATYDNIATELKVDVRDFEKGIYILQVVIDGIKSQQRVVVE